MRKILMICFLLIVSAVIIAQAEAQYVYDNEDLRTFGGTVSSVDESKQSLTVKGVEEMAFPISPDTKFSKDINDIRLSDVKAGDYVTVSYSKAQDGSITTLEVVVEYNKGEGW